MLAMFWRKEERGWRTTIAFNTFSSIVNGLLSLVSCIAYKIARLIPN